MTTKPTESTSSVEKNSVHQSITRETTEHVPQSPVRHGPLTDEMGLLSRKVCLKFDFTLVLPILTILCECLFK